MRRSFSFRMTSRLSQLFLLATAVLLSSCADQAGFSKIDGILGNDSFPLNQPASRQLAKSSIFPKDRHSMPVYSFNQHRRIVRTTAYTCSEWDHKIYGSKSAAGTKLLYGQNVRSAAADWSFYPVGTTFRIKGQPQLYVVDDYGSALTGTGTIDLYKPSKSMMREWGRRNVEVEIVQWGSFQRSAQLLSKRTRYNHCRQMLNNIIRIQPSVQRSL